MALAGRSRSTILISFFESSSYAIERSCISLTTIDENARGSGAALPAAFRRASASRSFMFGLLCMLHYQASSCYDALQIASIQDLIPQNLPLLGCMSHKSLGKWSKTLVSSLFVEHRIAWDNGVRAFLCEAIHVALSHALDGSLYIYYPASNAPQSLKANGSFGASLEIKRSHSTSRPFLARWNHLYHHQHLQVLLFPTLSFTPPRFKFKLAAVSRPTLSLNILKPGTTSIRSLVSMSSFHSRASTSAAKTSSR